MVSNHNFNVISDYLEKMVQSQNFSIPTKPGRMTEEVEVSNTQMFVRKVWSLTEISREGWLGLNQTKKSLIMLYITSRLVNKARWGVGVGQTDTHRQTVIFRPNISITVNLLYFCLIIGWMGW